MRHLIIACALLSAGCLNWSLHKSEDGCQVDSQCAESFNTARRSPRSPL